MADLWTERYKFEARLIGVLNGIDSGNGIPAGIKYARQCGRILDFSPRDVHVLFKRRFDLLA